MTLSSSTRGKKTNHKSVYTVQMVLVGTEHALCIKRFNMQPDEESDSETNSCGTVLSCVLMKKICRIFSTFTLQTQPNQLINQLGS